MSEGKQAVSDKVHGSKCIINLATGSYVKGQDRLRDSLQETGYKGELLTWTSESQIGAPLHVENPYAFKITSFREAERQGHRFVLWVDASVWAIKDVHPIFDHIAKHGYIMQEAGHNCGNWANDKCLEYFGITREEASKMLMYGNAGFLGLDLWDAYGKTFLLSWEKAMKAGAFKGDWSNHRHDMVCGSIIANQLHMEYQKGDEWMVYAKPEDEVNETIILKAQGL